MSAELTAPSEPFDWHALDRNSFLAWTVTNAISDRRGNHDLLHRTSDASDKFKNVVLTMQINGVEVNAVEFIDRVRSNMEHWSERRARELVSESTAFPAIEDALETARLSIERTLRDQLQAAGVEWLEER